jgi:hypothetical protein
MRSLQLAAMAIVGIGWVVAIGSLLAGASPHTSTWLILVSASLSAGSSYFSTTHRWLSVGLILAAAATGIAAIAVMRPLSDIAL